MADYKQDLEPRRNGFDTGDRSRVTDTGAELQEFDVQICVITQRMTLPGGLAAGWIRDVTADVNRLPQDIIQKGRAAATAQGITAAPTFVGILNDNGRATLILGWTR